MFTNMADMVRRNRSTESPSIAKQNGPLLEQFVFEVTDFSSQYGSDTSISYTAFNLVGKPTVYPKCGDYTQTFLMRTYGPWWITLPSSRHFISVPLPLSSPVQSQDYIEVRYEEQVYPVRMDIFETYNPGAVIRILCFCYEDNRWEVLWSGYPQVVPSQSRIFSPQLKRVKFVTDLFRIECNHRHLDYYCELDAILLVGTQDTLPDSDEYAISEACYGPFVNSLETLSISNEKASTNKKDLDLCYFEVLPNEVLHLIISYLDLESLCIASKVSKLFQKLCYDPVLYSELDLQPYWAKVRASALEGLNTRCSALHHLNLSWCGGQGRLTPVLFVQFLKTSCSWLTSLKIACCPFINNDCLKAIADFCPFLQELDLRSCRQRQLNQLGFMQISRMTDLTWLDLYRTLIERHSLLTIIRSCLKLEHLFLGSCSSVNNYDEVAKDIARNCRHIKSLDLWRAKSLTSVGVIAIAEHCHKLQEIDLGWCLQIDASSSCIRQLVSKCSHLRKLFLTAIRTISDSDLMSIADYCKDLIQLDILGTREIGPMSVNRILMSCNKLKFLDVSFCDQIDQHSVSCWREHFPSVSIKKTNQHPP